ncbi:hypothetical protein ACP70R_007747 [Stipagrostis hirtigluma subsp. patula]
MDANIHRVVISFVWETSSVTTVICSYIPEELEQALETGSSAQAIVVEDVHRAELMLEDVGWRLLLKSINISEEADVQHLWGIGLEIIRACGELPLAIKVIASILATK